MYIVFKCAPLLHNMYQAYIDLSNIRICERVRRGGA
jgi:hypothetical protein